MGTVPMTVVETPFSLRMRAIRLLSGKVERLLRFAGLAPGAGYKIPRYG